MSIELSNDAKELICKIYKAYLKRRETGKNKSEAKEIGDCEYIRETFAHEWSEDDTWETCVELTKAELFRMELDDSVKFTDKGIIYMEKNFGRTLEELSDKIKSIPFLSKLLY